MYTPRSEFPGLKASPNWVLSDAAGGTQVDLNHSQDLSRLINVLLRLLELHLLPQQLTWQATIHQAWRQ